MKQLLYITALLLTIGCYPTPKTEFTDRPAVCCYLVAEQSPTLTVQQLIPFQSDAQLLDKQIIEQLQITITDNTTDIDYTMSHVAGDKYNCPELIVECGHSYSLHFIYDNQSVSATTTVPDTPKNVSFSKHTISANGFGNMPMPMDAPGPNENIEITWSNDNQEYYIVEGVTESQTPIRNYSEDNLPAKSFKLNYTQGSSATLAPANFNYKGSYKISVIHIQPEYAVLSQGGISSSDATTLVDVRGNIEGGYGIFTGIGAVSRTVTVE